MQDNKNNLLVESDLNLYLNASKGGLDSPILLRLAQLSPSLFVTFIILCKELFTQIALVAK